MKEQEHNTNAVRSFKHYGYGAHKLSDIGGRTAGAKPCDIIARSPKGRYIAVEGKLMKKWEGFNSNILRPNQKLELDRTAATQEGRAFLFMYVHIPRVGHWCVVFDWAEYADIIFYGIKRSEMEEKKLGIWLPAIKDKDGKTIYDIRKIMRKAL